MKSDAFYQQQIKDRLSEKRYLHSLNVAQSAVLLARQYGADEKKAYTAGLVHDILKDDPKEKLLGYIKENMPNADPVLLSQSALWHSVAGAIYLEKSLRVDDPDIITAVRYHTSGRENMTLLEKVVFVADFISADRTYPGVEEMRELARQSLDKTIEEGLNFTIRELCDRRQPIYIDTIQAYNCAVLARKQTEEVL